MDWCQLNNCANSLPPPYDSGGGRIGAPQELTARFFAGDIAAPMPRRRGADSPQWVTAAGLLFARWGKKSQIHAQSAYPFARGRGYGRDWLDHYTDSAGFSPVGESAG